MKQIGQLKNQKDGLNRSIDHLIRETAYKTNHISIYQRQIDQLQRQLQHSNSVKNLALSKAKTQISGQNKKINQLINENASYADEIKSLKGLLAAATENEDTTASNQKPSKNKRSGPSRRSPKTNAKETKIAEI